MYGRYLERRFLKWPKIYLSIYIYIYIREGPEVLRWRHVSFMVNMWKLRSRLGNLQVFQNMVSAIHHHLERIIFFRPFNMTWMLSHFSFAQKWKFAFIGAKLRIFIVDTSLLDEKVFKSAGFLQWFCLRSILYCYSQWICMVAQIRRSDSQVFFVFRLRFSDGVMCLSWWACENCALA